VSAGWSQQKNQPTMSGDQLPTAVLNQLMPVLGNTSTAHAVIEQLIPVLENSLSNDQLDSLIKSNVSIMGYISADRLRALIAGKVAIESDTTKLGMIAFPPAAATASRHCSTCGGEGHNTRSCTAKDTAVKIVEHLSDAAGETSDDEDM